MVMDLLLIIIKVSDNSYALKDDNNEKSTTKEIAKKEYEVKTAEEVDNNKTDNVDMVSLDIPNDAVSVVNSEYRIPDNLLSDLNNTIASYGSGSSFLVVNLNNGMSFGYNIDNAYASGYITYIANINPLEKVIELYERLLKSEQEKLAILQEVIQDQK